MKVNTWGLVNTWDTGVVPGTAFTVDYAALSANSPFAGDTRYSQIVAGDTCIHDALTAPDSLGMTMAGNGEFTIAGDPANDQTFSIQIYDLSDGSTGTTGTITVLPFAGASLSANVAGASAIAGVLTTYILSGLLAGGSTLTGSLEAAADELGGILNGSSTVAANLTDFPAVPGELFEGTLAGTSTLSGAIVVGDGLQGGLSGTSAVTGDLTDFPVSQLAGDLAGASGFTGALSTAAGLSGTLDGESFAWATFASDFPPRIPATVDLTPFFNNDELSHDAILNGAIPFKAIVTDWYDPIIGGTVGMGATDPLLIAQHDDIPDVQDGDTVVIAAYSYTIREVQPDNTGIVRLKCELSL